MHPHPHVLDCDLAAGLIVGAFAISNGWLGSVAMMLAPSLVRNPSHQEAAGAVMVRARACAPTVALRVPSVERTRTHTQTLALQVGICIGATVSWAIVPLLA